MFGISVLCDARGWRYHPAGFFAAQVRPCPNHA